MGEDQRGAESTEGDVALVNLTDTWKPRGTAPADETLSGDSEHRVTGSLS